jgi:arabinogalactan oligomer / maltooligosaccharide transport system substrate-binding protein
MPPQAAMRCVWDAMRPNQEAVMANKMTPADAAAAMQTAADKCVAELK